MRNPILQHFIKLDIHLNLHIKFNNFLICTILQLCKENILRIFNYKISYYFFQVFTKLSSTYFEQNKLFQ